MMRPIQLKRTVAALGLMAILAVGCVEREETIVVHTDGSVTLHVKITGERGDFRAPLAFPSPPAWTIIEDHTDTAGVADSVKLMREAEMTVAYGEPLPSSFASQNAPGYEQALHFPSSIRKWTKDGREYYEFKRTYRARRYGCYNLAGSKLWGEDLWDEDLEDRILEQGIFNASPEDRAAYLEQFGTAFGYLQWRLLWQALGKLREDGDMDDSTRLLIEMASASYLEETITNEHLLDLMKKHDANPDSAMTRLTAEIRDRLQYLVYEQTGAESSPLKRKFTAAYNSVLRDYAITEALGAQRFSIDIQMPGQLIDANGLVDHDDPSSVHWEFDGNDLHDVDIPLYALSVVDHPNAGR